MKKSFKLFMALLLIGGFALSFSSCKDSENVSNDPNSPENIALSKQSESAQALLSVLSYTSGLDSLPDNWASNSYTVEPKVGVVKEESTPYVRYIVVNDKEEAIDTYNAIGEKTLTEDATSDTWNIENVGSLSFKVLDQSDVTATLDINIKQQPHLTQIRFVPASAMGDNSLWGLKVDPYYQFGDVVSLKEGDKKTYWICARPCSKYYDKKESHWFSFNLIDNSEEEDEEEEDEESNTIVFTSSDYGTLKLPTKLGNKSLSAKHIPNLFKLLMLIDDPQKYTTIDFPKGLGEIKRDEFTDVKLQSISSAWTNKNIWKTISPSAYISQEDFKTCFNVDYEVNAFYNGYSYWTKPTVYMVNLSGTTLAKDNKKSGSISWKRTRQNVDFMNYVTYGQVADFPSELPSRGFIVRYKSGAELANAKNSASDNDPQPDKSFHEQNSLVEDVYTYRKDVVEQTDYKRAIMGDLIMGKDLFGETENEVCVIKAVEQTGYYAYFISNTSGIGASTYGLQNKQQSTTIYCHILNAIMLHSDYYKEYIKNKNKTFSDDYSKAVGYLFNAFKENCGNSLENVVDYYVTDLSGKSLPANITADQEFLFNIKFPYTINDGKFFKYGVLSYNTKTNKYLLKVIEESHDLSEEITKAVKITKYKDIAGNQPSIDPEHQYFMITILTAAERKKMQDAIDKFVASCSVDEL